jgi:hypothetical protein
MSDSHALNRRHFLGRSMVTLAAGAALGANAAQTPAPKVVHEVPPPKDPVSHPSGMPYGKIGNVKLSRLILGGNLVAACMHCRDLKYVPQLARAYVTEEKIYQTFKVCEEHGINTVLETGAQFVNRYNKERGGHMQIIPSFGVLPDHSDQLIKDRIKAIVDTGAPMFYMWGVSGDTLTRAGRVDRIARSIELAKAHGLPVGVGAHSLQVPMACEKARVPCDFYVKTLHSDNYKSAIPKELRREYIWLDEGRDWNDNMWCINPEETIAFMQTVQKPWIAFKVLAAGAFLPRDGFSYAFKGGADFAGVGMFDFQIKEDSEIIRRVVNFGKGRQRPWCG